MSMSKDRDFRHWLYDIIEWSERLERHISGVSESGFTLDVKTQDAVIRCIECIGEASHQVIARKEELGLEPGNSDFFEAYWARNRLAHGYFDIDLSRVWLTATVSVPRLALHVKSIIDRRPEGRDAPVA
jgi:uncharacterized protein with HEPN domain